MHVATQRSASGRIAGPLSPAGRPSGSAAGSALPTTTAAAPASTTVGPPRRPAPGRTAAWPARAVARAARGARRRPRRPRGTARGRRRPGCRSAAGADRLTSIAATPGARPSRRASSAYSPSVRPATQTTTRGAVLDQPGQLGGEEASTPGFWSRRRAAARRGSPRSAGAARPAAASRVIERVTKPPRPGGATYGAELAAGAAAARPRPAPGSASAVRLSSRSQRTRSPRKTGPSVAGPDQRARRRPRRPRAPRSRGTGRWRRAAALQRELAPGAVLLGGRRRCRAGSRAGGVDDLGLCDRRQATTDGDGRRAADRAVAGDDGDRPRGRRASSAPNRWASSAAAEEQVTAQPRSRSRSASGNSGAAAYPSPTRTQRAGSFGSANGRPSGPVTSTGVRPASAASQRVPGPPGSTTSSSVAP